MCGRFTLTVSARVLADLFQVEHLPDLAPRYNIAPTQPVLIVRSSGAANREAATVHWGLIPGWAKERTIGARMINARSETLAEKPAFRGAVRHRRCLIPADGFYEWRKVDGGKQPYLIRFSDRRPFAFAGLWERWHGPEAQPLESCTIITTPPNELVAALHNRMPVILPAPRFGEWLQPEPLPPTRMAELLVPYPAAEMEAFQVSRRVNSPTNDDLACVAAVEPPAS